MSTSAGTRTGSPFQALKVGGAFAGPSPVCRFYAARGSLDSHFYTANKAECQTVQDKFATSWQFESTKCSAPSSSIPTTGVARPTPTPSTACTTSVPT